jgi:hypothetical protein
MVSIILQEYENATNTIQFIAKRINKLGVLAHNISIGNLSYITYISWYIFTIFNFSFLKKWLTGVRIVNVIKVDNFSDILDSELDYLEHCTDNPFGK